MMSNIEIIDKKLTSVKFKNNNLVVDGDIFITDHKVLFGLGMERALDLLGSTYRPVVNSDGVNFTIKDIERKLGRKMELEYIV